ncbi:unnamed protein product [Pedinophyceae sp. YPF-701]|nr:unnamed protein product [Pedinophyceae sp. YPF-701]
MMRARSVVVRTYPDPCIPETEKERSTVDIPQEWLTPQPSRRPDIFPEFERLQTPDPKPMPGDPEMPDEEELEEEDRKRKEPEEDPEQEGEEEEKEEDGEEEDKRKRKRKGPGQPEVPN